MEKYFVSTKWTKEFGEEVIAKYPFAKKVYLSQESNSQNVLQLMDSLNHNPFLANLQTEESVATCLSQNPIFSFVEGIDCTIRQGYYTLPDEHIEWENCVCIFLFENESIFQEFSSHFPTMEENL